jgi:hypothetical protein
VSCRFGILIQEEQNNEAILADLHDATPNPAFQFFYQKKKHA